MKNFLIDKFNNFTKSAETASFVSFTKNLPSILHLTPSYIEDEGFPSWGSEENGYWTVNKTEARYYENDGTIHCVGIQYNNEYCENYRLLSDHLTEIRSLLLAETDSFQITAEDHASHAVGDTVYYAKFVSPSGEFGKPIGTMMMKGELPFETDTFNFIIDLFFKAYSGFKSAKILCPSSFTQFSILADSQGYYIGLVPDFSVSLEQSIDNILANEVGDDGRFSLLSEIENYGLEKKWQLLKM
jgi:hypothetical protein